jgi:hypothetical protein
MGREWEETQPPRVTARVVCALVQSRTNVKRLRCKASEASFVLTAFKQIYRHLYGDVVSLHVFRNTNSFEAFAEIAT